MSTVTVNGALILNGELTCDGNITVTAPGIVFPIASEQYTRSYYSCETRDYKSCSGRGRVIKSIAGNIDVEGLIDGDGLGFDTDRGPGCNSVLLDNMGFAIKGYGATHAGVGAMRSDSGSVGLIFDQFTLTNDEAVSREVRLSGIPVDYANVVLNIIQGTSQYYLSDFYFREANILTWVGTILEGLLSDGDQIRVIYVGDTAQVVPSPKPPYGCYEAPISLGSSSYETRGGGGIKLDARSGLVTINGTITMAGESGGVGVETGGGAGGSVWVAGWGITGTGTIASEGGGTSWTYAGGGGGGYVALCYERCYSFSGVMSVIGKDGAEKGITFVKQFESILLEKFTGHILNPKWWTYGDPVILDNYARFDSSQGQHTYGYLQSLFSISGKNILADLDFLPLSSEISVYNAYFLLYVDVNNWIGVARKNGHLFGTYSVGGAISQSAIAADYSSTTFRILKSDSTFSFQYFQDCTSPQTIYTDVVDAFSSSRFSVRLGLDKIVGVDEMAEYFLLTNSNIASKYVTLSGPPIDASNVALSPIKGTAQHYGYDFYVSGQELWWDTTGGGGLVTLLDAGDVLRVQYEVDTTSNATSVGFDNLKVYDGILFDTETVNPVLYVDPIHGSDTSVGGQLSPLQNLFVATAWAKKGGTVVLYDGTHNPTEVIRKDLTIRGADGAVATITSRQTLDTTGSGWEHTGLSFSSCQGRIQNVVISGTGTGVYADNAKNLIVSGCDIGDATTGVRFDGWHNESPVVFQTRIHDVDIGVDFTACYDPTVNSCIFLNDSTAILAYDASNLIVTSSTFDNNGACVVFDSSARGFVVSNNLTSSDVGIVIASDASPVYSLNNNFYGTATQYIGTPDGTYGNISADPLYVGATDYHLQVASPNRNTGSIVYDAYRSDYGHVRRDASVEDIGAYQYSSGAHVGDFYVAGDGNDYGNFGGIGDPFRTLDRAMQDATIHVNSGHYDTFYLGLKSVDVTCGYTLFTLHPHFSNIDLGRAIYVSPNGSDSTIVTGDGTQGYGTGSLQHPYRTIQKALAVSSYGDNIVAFAGEYPRFSGLDGRVVIPVTDQTSLGTRWSYVQDFFAPRDFRGWNWVEYDSGLWDFTGSGTSSVVSGSGYLELNYDGSNLAQADSKFKFTGDFEVSADLRNSVDPVYFSVTSPDNTAYVQFYDGSYIAGVVTPEDTYTCWGRAVPIGAEWDFFTEYLCLNSDDTRNGYALMKFAASDCSSSAVSIVGGVPQEYGVDYTLQANKIVWRGLGMDGVLEPGDIVRVTHRSKDLAGPVKFRIAKAGDRITIKSYDFSVWETLKKKLIVDSDATWACSFYMDQTGSSEHGCQLGKGYISNFLAVADTFEATDSSAMCGISTARKSAIFY
jgi:hypothetical protein